jgi:hypothetical protein
MKMNFHKTPTIHREPLYTYDIEQPPMNTPIHLTDDISPFAKCSEREAEGVRVNSRERSSSEFEAYENTASFALYVEPILNSYYKQYQNIITLNTVPPGPLRNMVVQINVPKLSEFQTVSPMSSPTARNGGRCIYALMRYPKGSRQQTVKNANMYMSANDIPAVYGYLKANGYRIDTSLTKMTFQSPVKIGGIDENGYGGNRKLICFVDRAM